jgi:hypothetical protein
VERHFCSQNFSSKHDIFCLDTLSR